MTRYTVFVTIPEFYVEAEVECSSKPTEDDILQALHCEASIEGDALPDHIELVHCYDGGVDSEVVVTIEQVLDALGPFCEGCRARAAELARLERRILSGGGKE